MMKRTVSMIYDFKLTITTSNPIHGEKHRIHSSPLISNNMIHMPIHATFETSSSFELRRARLQIPVVRTMH
uniref:Ovule protein n=1 Tax=Caenorhabditis tropicalis TaxID=1561998 RepID=A0A1I7T748_9PELO